MTDDSMGRRFRVPSACQGLDSARGFVGRHIIRKATALSVTNVDRSSHSSNALMQLVRTHDTPTRRCGKVPVPAVRRDNHLAMREMPRLRPPLQVPEMRLLRAIEGNRIWQG